MRRLEDSSEANRSVAVLECAIGVAVLVWGVSLPLLFPVVQNTAATKAITELRLNGYDVDQNMTDEFNLAASQTGIHTFSVYISSPGGFWLSTLAIGADIRQMQRNNISVIFYITGECMSGCFVDSTFASWVYVYPNATIGLQHDEGQLPNIWGQVIDTISQNKNWTQAFTESMAPYGFNATEAVKLGLADGIAS